MEVQPDEPNNAVDNEQHTKAQEFKASGNEKYNKNNFKGAIADYQKGLMHEPNNPELHANLSAAYIKLEKYIEAEEHAIFTIHLRPNFYKGYMRAAKADHGKGMTRLALKRLSQGLSNVVDPNGLKELNRLKNQYTAYLSLQSNSEREMEFDSDTYQSEDEEDEGLSTDEDSGDDQPPPAINGLEPPQSLKLPPVQPAVPSLKPLPPSYPPETPVHPSPLPVPVHSEDVPGKHETDKTTADPSTDRSTADPSTNRTTADPSTDKSTTDPSTDKSTTGPSTDKSTVNSQEPEKQAEPVTTEDKVDTSDYMRDAKADHGKWLKRQEGLKELTRLGNQYSAYLSSQSNSEKGAELDPDKDAPGNNSEDKYERPIDRLRELAQSSELKKSIADFKENLKTGGEAYLAGNYRKAADNYKTAYERVGKRYYDYETDERQCNVIRYASYAAMINLNTYDDIVKSIHGLNEMTIFAYDFPAIYIQIARAYYKLNRYKSALEPLEKVQAIIDNVPIFPTFIWPGTNDTIEETTPSGLKNAIKELNQLCRVPHKPTAICRYNNCLKTTAHIVPSELIYSTDPDFIGYVRIMCEEKCHIEFHVPCWKSYKESVCGIGKINDKDFLGRPCLTTDCINSEGNGSSIIISIEIIGSDGQVKSVNKLDPKANAEQKAAEKKIKKKKSKLDDKENKEKVVKPKKPKEKKVKSKEKKPSQAVQDDGNDDDEDLENANNHNTLANRVKDMGSRKQSWLDLRLCNFGKDNKNEWNPSKPFYGNHEQAINAELKKFLDHTNDPAEIIAIKDYFFSYFLDVLKNEGPLKLDDVEEHWKEQGGDIKNLLPNITSVSDLLLESTRFCQLGDHLYLADHLDEGFATRGEEIADVVSFIMTAASTAETDSQQTDSTKDQEDIGSFSGEDSDDESSSCEFDHSSDDGTDDEDIADQNLHTSFLPPATVEGPLPPQPDENFSLDDILEKFKRLKDELVRSPDGEDTCPTTSKIDISHEQAEEKGNETFETAHGSSADNSAEDMKMSPPADSSTCFTFLEHRENVGSGKMEPETPLPSSEDQTDQQEPVVEVTKAPEVQETFESTECDKGSQSEIVTEERHIQTAPLETKHRLSQTKESDLYKELNKKVQELSSQLALAHKDKERLSRELVSEKQILKAQHDTIAKLHEENKKNINEVREQVKSELLKKDKEYKKREEEQAKKLNNMKEMYSNLSQENIQLKKEISVLLKDTTDVKKSLTAALTNMKEFEGNYKSLEMKMKCRLQKAQQSQLMLVKTCWETQLNLLKKRCVERITEMQGWFSVVGSSGEVETLPSYPLIQRNIMQWMEMAKQQQQIEADFQEKYAATARKIEQGIDMEDLKPDMLPMMPKEPAIPPLEKIHKEITEKLQKTISDLTQLVASQQLQIEKGKEQADQLRQIMMTFQTTQMAPPRAPSQPMTTTFGGLALQYPYPGAMNPPFPGPTGVPSANPDTSFMGNSSKLLDVHSLLKESSNILNSSSSVSSMLSPSLKDEASIQMPPPGGTYHYPPPMVPPPTRSLPPAAAAPGGPIHSKPPPPISTQSMYMPSPTVPSSTVPSTTELKKEIKPPEQRGGTPKPEQRIASSRESTPVRTAPAPAPSPAPAPAPAPVPEKTKKKKKTKTGEAAAAEARVAAAVSLEHQPAVYTAADDSTRDDGNDWNVVLPKSALQKHSAQPPAPLTEGKMKNKKKLLDKLQARFPTIQLKDIEDIVKQVREHNNGSLSGLPFDEIETRVERLITKRQMQKNSTMGLVKFSDKAWGSVKPQETKSWLNLQHDECTICLEPMGIDRTKVDCSHEFHTKCLRMWLKEKSVCPLCNKFTTMPDEFPALW